ncbi:hypothetical protein AaE_010649 [Aphanomyces astaci]|uniref:Uncharacterized protein n=1 Tax=Aphanomyces astaci TaxID=112090 RepID=A0A6A4ZYI4_APHAT|nr:hypothetical protein AaE_010649 [Aphanomyces astaci]
MQLTDINQQQISHSTRSDGGRNHVTLLPPHSQPSSTTAPVLSSPSLLWPAPAASLTTLENDLHDANTHALLCRPHNTLVTNLTTTHPTTTVAAGAGGLPAAAGLLRKATDASSKPIDNPFESWYRANKPRRLAPRRAASSISCSTTQLGDVPPPPPSSMLSFSSSSFPCMSVGGGDCTDNEDDYNEPRPMEVLAGPSNARRHKAVDDAQRHFRCMDMACMMDVDDDFEPPPPVLVRAQAQLLLHCEHVDLTCAKCGSVERVAISY